VLKYGGGGLGVAVLGYFGYTEFLAGGDGGPKSVVRGYLEASQNGNIDEARSYIHSESSITLDGSGGGGDGQSSLSIDNLEQRDSLGGTGETTSTPDGPERTYVIATLSAETPTAFGIQTVRVGYELRKEDGEWKIFSETTIGTS